MFQEPTTPPLNFSGPLTSAHLKYYAIPNVITSKGQLYEVIDQGRGRELPAHEIKSLNLLNPFSNRNLLEAIEKGTAACLQNK